jgi:sulfonate transport system permease protein
MSLFSMTVQPVAAPREAHALARYAGPALGLVLPVGLAIAWELAVRAGVSDGRLVPPPSRIWATLVELAAAGELQRHVAVTVGRVAAGFAFGVAAGTLLGALAGYSALTRRSPGCRCSSCGSAFSKPRRSR